MNNQNRPIRVLVAKVGLDGHDRGAKVEDMKQLNSEGVGRLFAPGTPTSEIAGYIQNWVAENRSF
ncbi:MAG: hypothetical protein EON98_15540 [Chitinophagaceae bacterium]|nr:MAG: hypothetical protein EON98_15540 [Chitinophagaceae bacterium]